MKRPEEIDMGSARLQGAVRDWIEECEPSLVKGIMYADFGRHRDVLREFVEAEWKAEATKRLADYGWRVLSFEYNRVAITQA